MREHQPILSSFAAFLLYDWMASLPDELTLIWFSENRRTICSLVYFLTRYTPIMDGVICILTINDLSWLVCNCHT